MSKNLDTLVELLQDAVVALLNEAENADKSDYSLDNPQNPSIAVCERKTHANA